MRRKKYSIRAGGSSTVEISPVAEDTLRTVLCEGSLLLIDGDGRDIAIMCAEGIACLTQPSDPEDHILHQGETFIIDKKGLVAVTALADTQMVVSA